MHCSTLALGLSAFSTLANDTSSSNGLLDANCTFDDLETDSAATFLTEPTSLSTINQTSLLSVMPTPLVSSTATIARVSDTLLTKLSHYALGSTLAPHSAVCLFPSAQTPVMPILPWLWTQYMYHLRYVIAFSVPVCVLMETIHRTVRGLVKFTTGRVLITSGHQPPPTYQALSVTAGLLMYTWVYHGTSLWGTVLADMLQWIDLLFGTIWRFVGPLYIFTTTRRTNRYVLL